MKKLALYALLTAMIAPLTAANAEVIENLKVPVAQSVFVPCANDGAGEDVTLEGPLHILVTLTINDNHVSGVEHFQPQNVKGVGQTTGDVYQATGVSREQFGGSFVNGVFEATAINNFRIIGPGRGNNLLVHAVTHITVNANGDVTASVDIESTECR